MELFKAFNGRSGPPGRKCLTAEEDKSAGVKEGRKGSGADRENVVGIVRFRENLPKGGETVGEAVNGSNALFCMGLEKCHIVVPYNRASGRKSLQGKSPGRPAVAGDQSPEGPVLDHRKRKRGDDPHVGEIGHVDRRDTPQI